MKNGFQAFNHGKEQIDLSHYNNIYEMRPVEIHLKEDGDINNNPSFAIVMENYSQAVVGQISLDMFNNALQNIGYKIEKL